MVLSVGDILTALVYIPTHIANVHLLTQVKDPCTVYSIEQFIGVFLGTSATILTSIICMDRYFFISRPYRNTGASVNTLSSKSSSTHADKSGRKLFALYCIFSFCVSLALGITVATIANGNSNFRAATIFNIVSIVIYIVMLLASLVFNTLLVRYVHKQSKEIRRMTKADGIVVVQKPYRNRATKTVLMISGIQIFTIMPWVLSLAYMTFEFGENSYVDFIDEIYYMHTWLKMPMFLNSFLNAVVFIHRNQQLMKFYRALLSRMRSDSTK